MERKLTISAYRPWCDISPELQYFAGEGVYRTCVHIPAGTDKAVLVLPDVSDTFIVRVNGEEADFPDQVRKLVDITTLIREGENKIEICVVSTLHNSVVSADTGAQATIMRTTFPGWGTPKKYGILEREDMKMPEVRLFKAVKKEK